MADYRFTRLPNGLCVPEERLVVLYDEHGNQIASDRARPQTKHYTMPAETGVFGLFPEGERRAERNIQYLQKRQWI